MTTLTIAGGRDSWINYQYPNTSGGRGQYPLIRGTSTVAQTLVHLPLVGIAGRNVASATLSVPVYKDWAAQTLYVWALDGGWSAKRVTWNTVPPSRLPPQTTAVGPLSAGERLEMDVTTLVQAVAGGARDYGFVLGTAGDGGRVHGFESGGETWVLTVEISEVSEAPDSLSPDGRIGTGAPVLTWVTGDTTLEPSDQTAFEVQIDAAEDGVTPDWTSGTVTSPVPQLALADTDYPGLAADATTAWRVRVLDGGEWSEWSDWVEFTHTAKPSVVVTSPTGAAIYDPSPVLEFGVDAGTMEAYRVLVTPAADPTRVLYDSGLVDAESAASVLHTVPTRDRQGRLVFADDQSYRLVLRAYDLLDRVPTAGDPEYAEQVVTVAFDDDVHPPIDGLWATQPDDGPNVKVRWTRSSAADGWAVIRDGVVIARLEHDDFMQEDGPVVADVEGGWSWLDRTAAPWAEQVYEVKALLDKEDGTGAWTWSTTGGYRAWIEPQVTGLWLIRANGDAAVLAGEGVDDFRTTDRRARYSPPGVGYDVDIITAFEGVTGSFKGSFDTTTVEGVESQRVLAAIKNDPTTPVRLVYATVSVPVLLRDLSQLPAGTWMEHLRQYDVSFGFFQAGEFAHRVGR